MTTIFPLRFRRIKENEVLFSNEAGRFFRSNDAFLNRLTASKLTIADESFLCANGLAFQEEGDVSDTSYLHTLSRRLRPPGKLSYVLLVPTLRCDLSCSYCQVSRAAENALNYDWSEDVLNNVLAYLDKEAGQTIQIEFQGGEPTLRIDLIAAVIDFCRNRFQQSKFVICTNLSRLSPELRNLLNQPDVHISTSFDGTAGLHRQQRTQTEDATVRFFENLSVAQEIAGDRVSALPTLDPLNLPTPTELLDGFKEFGMRSVYLRPIVYHGFARKRHPTSRSHNQAWQTFYDQTVDLMIERNAATEGVPFEEFYMTLAIKRLLQPGHDQHVDLRSPNWLGHDHQVIDFDGQIYPTDEARMMARSGQVDLSIGSVTEGVNHIERRKLQGQAINALDPWCSQCVYQSACGSDPVDDLARTGRADPVRPDTPFCQRHTHIFNKAMSLIYSEEEVVRASIARWLELPAPVRLAEVLHDQS